MGGSESFRNHLDSGHTTLARCWQIMRRDGSILGFTDHDLDLKFLETLFQAGTGLSAQVIEQSTGLSVDNSEAIGALSHASIREEDVNAGRYDGAKVTAWLVNWTNVEDRIILFRGSIGEIKRNGAMFQAELRGLTEPLNQPGGRIYQRDCSAVLGDQKCGFDLSATGFTTQIKPTKISDNRVFHFAELSGFAPRWFEQGRIDVVTGKAKGLFGLVKRDRSEGVIRVIELWAPLEASVSLDDLLELQAGCDKRFETCRLKFLNHYNFQGFPDLPSEDWLTVGPRDDGQNDGRSLRG